MSRIWALAVNTFREAVRDKIWLSILFFAIGAVFLSLALKEITIGDQAKVVRSVAQGGIDFFSAVIAMFLGISLVWKELDKKTIYTILSKPIPRWMFLLGKYSGLMMTVVVAVFSLTLIYVLLMTFQQDFPPLILFVSILMLVVELMLLTAWATLFSSYSAPTTATLFTMAVFFIGHMADDIWLFGNKSESPMIQEIARLLYWLLPNFEALSIREGAVHGREVPWTQVWHGILYGLGYTITVLAATVMVFERKDMK